MPSLTATCSQGAPIVHIGVSVSRPRRLALLAINQPIPQPQFIPVMIDTGANCTCIDPTIFPLLGIQPTGSVLVHTPSTRGMPARQNQYDVDISILLANGVSHFVDTLPVLEADLASQGICGLLGCDVLSQGILIFNGPANSFTLAF